MTESNLEDNCSDIPEITLIMSSDTEGIFPLVVGSDVVSNDDLYLSRLRASTDLIS